MKTESGKNSFEGDKKAMNEFDLKGRGITDIEVLKVMSDIPREEFVSGDYKCYSYGDGPLPIGCGQTISQPFIVALMTQELKVSKEHEVLEIGTGSGYQTAILAGMAKKVYTIERFNNDFGTNLFRIGKNLGA